MGVYGQAVSAGGVGGLAIAVVPWCIGHPGWEIVSKTEVRS